MFTGKNKKTIDKAAIEYHEYLKYNKLKDEFEKGDFTHLQKFLENKIHSIETLNFILEWAVTYGRLDCVEKLHFYGANIAQDYNNFIRIACMNGYLDIINYFWKIKNNLSDEESIILINLIIDSDKIETIKHMVENKIFDFHLKLDQFLNKAILFNKYNLIKDLFILGAKINENEFELLKSNNQMYRFIQNIMVELGYLKI